MLQGQVNVERYAREHAAISSGRGRSHEKRNALLARPSVRAYAAARAAARFVSLLDFTNLSLAALLGIVNRL